MRKLSFSALSLPAAQRGVALIFVLIMMTIAISVGLLSARSTLSGNQAARNERDRQIAFQAAEFALNDAELDIMDPNFTRGCKFGTAAFQINFQSGCNGNSPTHGLCGLDATKVDSSGNAKPFYTYVDWTASESSSSREYVLAGEMTNRSNSMQVQSGSAADGMRPAKRSRYIIAAAPGGATLPVTVGSVTSVVTTPYAYKVYALGYGANEETQVMLESHIVKPALDKQCSGS